MKRTQPSSENSCLKRQCVEAKYSLDTLPKDLFHLILSFLDYKGLSAAQQTCKTLATTDHIWEKVFDRDFGATFPLLLGPEWPPAKLEYKLQCAFTRSFPQGCFASRIYCTEKSGIVAYGATPDGRLIISDLKGFVRVLDDAKTDHWVVLHKEEHDIIEGLVCEGNLCVGITARRGWMRAWNMDTYEEIPIPQGGKGFSLERGDKYEIALNHGRLLRYNHHQHVVEIWNPQLPHDPVLSFPFGVPVFCMAFHNKTLYCSRLGGMELCDITTGARKVHPMGEVRKIHVVNEKKYFVFLDGPADKKLVKCINHTNHTIQVSSLTLFDYPGVAKEFTGQWEPGGQECSILELSSIFQAFASELATPYLLSSESKMFQELSPLKGMLSPPARSSPVLRSMMRGVTGFANIYSSSRGKLYCGTFLNLTKKAILCADFTASHRDIFLELSEMFTHEDLVNTATERLMRMPESVKEAIGKIYKKLWFVWEAESPTPGKLWEKALLEYLTPGSVITEEAILHKILELLASIDERELEYGKDAFRKRLSPFVKEAIHKIQEKLATDPELQGKSPEEILVAAILEYLCKGESQ